MVHRIKELREQLFKTQANMAKALGLKTNAISAYEVGTSFLKPEKIAYLVESYNLNANWLLTGKGNMFLKDTDTIGDKDKITELEKENERLKAQLEVLKELINQNR